MRTETWSWQCAPAAAESMPRNGSLILSDVREPTLAIVREPKLVIVRLLIPSGLQQRVGRAQARRELVDHVPDETGRLLDHDTKGPLVEER